MCIITPKDTPIFFFLLVLVPDIAWTNIVYFRKPDGVSSYNTFLLYLVMKKKNEERFLYNGKKVTFVEWIRFDNKESNYLHFKFKVKDSYFSIMRTDPSNTFVAYISAYKIKKE